ncbi:RluA family pseudouridine synthase [Helicobacter ibis]|uniref:RNA pseudouridylate synthase n=1 Tax=Helicobacter ibis TaxID=2962633 RepID=A0ABT4VFB4_9HELI|nr:RluA family pseudouridine synthase [Helicobacter ibis]MDA3969297.1 RluA family pseudouridine synthase [Helicobacter ibis]
MPFILERFYIQEPIKAFRFLMDTLKLSMAQSQRYINKGRVVYNGDILGNNDKNKLLENFVDVLVFKPNRLGVKAVFENDDFIVFDKPEKLLIHPKGRFNHKSLVDEIRSHCGNDASLIHRIDKETSGLVLVGKHKDSIRELGDMFAKNLISKEYLALCRGYLSRDFCISVPISTQAKGRDLSIRSVFLGENLNGNICTKDSANFSFKDSKSEFEILGHIFNNTLLKVRLYSGRTHQIRVHLHSINHAILGDPLYGCEDFKVREYLDSEFIEGGNFTCMSDSKRIEYFGASRLMLHSYSMKFRYKNINYFFKSPFSIFSNL